MKEITVEAELSCEKIKILIYKKIGPIHCFRTLEVHERCGKLLLPFPKRKELKFSQRPERICFYRAVSVNLVF